MRRNHPRPGPRLVRAGHRQHRRRLLRHHAPAHRRDRADGEGLSAAHDPAARAPTPPRRHRTDDPRRLMAKKIRLWHWPRTAWGTAFIGSVLLIVGTFAILTVVGRL